MRFGAARVTGFTSAVLLASVVAVTAPSTASAQIHGGHVHGVAKREYDDARQSRVRIGGGLGVAIPQGEFGRLVGEGFGAQVYSIFGLDRSNVIALRIDAGYVNYGSERFTIPIFPGIGRVGGEVRTRNNIATFGIGPQLQVPNGPVRPYVNGFVGVGYFFTESSVNDGFVDFGSTLNFDDTTFAYGFGGGLGLQLGRGSVELNLDVQYRKHDDAEYLREGGIIDDGFGGVILNPIRSDADFLTFQVGVSVGL